MRACSGCLRYICNYIILENISQQFAFTPPDRSYIHYMYARIIVSGFHQLALIIYLLCLRPLTRSYIRYIYNRIILENATVRAAAVSALASFGARVPELTARVVVLLKRALYDNDDEVRCLV